MRETQRKSTITKKWRDEPFNALVINLAGSLMQRSGLPDTLLIKDRLHIWIEFKSTDGEVTGNQEKCHKDFADQGIHVFVVRFVSDSLWLIDEQYEIKLKHIKFGAKLLFDTLISLARPLAPVLQEGGFYVSQNITSIISPAQHSSEGGR